MTEIELIPVTKGGEYLEVHPTALADHQRCGWSQCARQEAADAPDTNGDGKVTAAELKAALTAAGVTFKSNASKGDLIALHTAFERSGLTGAEWNNLADEDRADRIAQ